MVGDILWLCCFGVAVGVPVLNRMWSDRAHRAHALRVGQALGLRLETRLIGPDALVGQVDSVDVRISWHAGSPQRRGKLERPGWDAPRENAPIANIVVDASGLIPRQLSFEAEGLFGSLGKLITGADVEVQDERFDADVLARGPAPTIVALMNTKTRNLLRGMISVVGARILDGKIEVSAALDDVRAIESIVRTLVEISRAMELDAKHTIQKRLLENALHDPVPAVRQNNLSILLAEYRGSREAEQAIAAASKDPDPGVAVLAACAAGADGLAKLQSLASSSSTSEAIRFVALRHLAKRSPSLSIPLLERALDDQSPAVRRLAIEALGRMRHRPCLPRILELCGALDEDTALQAAGAVGWMGQDAGDAELDAFTAALHPLLGHRNANVRAAALRSLGRVGRPTSIGALRPLTRRLNPPHVRQAAEMAIAQIRARHGSPSAGRLSVVEASDQAGALSLESDAGRISHIEQALDPEAIDGREAPKTPTGSEGAGPPRADMLDERSELDGIEEVAQLDVLGELDDSDDIEDDELDDTEEMERPPESAEAVPASSV